MLDARDAEAYVVPRVRFRDSGVVRHTKTRLTRFVVQGVENVAMGDDDLYPVDAYFFQIANPLSRLVRRLRSGRVGEARVDEDPRRRYFSPLTFSSKVDQALRVVCANFTHARDSARKPELELIVQGLRNTASLDLNVPVTVDETGKNVLSFCVDLCRSRRPLCFPVGDRHGIEPYDLGDSIAANDYVRGSDRGSSGTIDDYCVANDQ